METTYRSVPGIIQHLLTFVLAFAVGASCNAADSSCTAKRAHLALVQKQAFFLKVHEGANRSDKARPEKTFAYEGTEIAVVGPQEDMSKHGVTSSVNLHEFYSPGWLIQSRCSGSECENCATEDEGCLGSVDEEKLGVIVPASSTWRTAVSTWEMHCEKEANITFKIIDIHNGSLSFYWDEAKVRSLYDNRARQHISTDSLPVGTWLSFDVKPENPHGHEFKMVFEADPLTYSSALLNEPRISIHEEGDMAFAACVNQNACLKALSAEPNLLEGMDLRQHKDLQYRCLTNEATLPSQALLKKCREWKDCLHDDFEARIVTMLLAGGITGDEESLSRNAGARGSLSSADTTSSADISTCIDPKLEDPEAWTCDCYDDWKTYCLEADPEYRRKPWKCLQMIMCGSPRVCDDWKNATCASSSEEVVSQLQMRAAPQQATRQHYEQEVDGVVRAKKCM